MDLARFFPKPHCENVELRAKFQGIRGGDISPSLPWFWHALFQNCTVKTQNCVPNSRGSGGWEHFSATAAMDLARFFPKPHCENAELRAKFQGIRGGDISPSLPWILARFSSKLCCENTELRAKTEYEKSAPHCHKAIKVRHIIFHSNALRFRKTLKEESLFTTPYQRTRYPPSTGITAPSK